MSLTNRNKIFSVNESEYGYLAKDFLPVASDKTIPIYVPKLMGSLNGTGVETIIDSNMFDNDPSCKPKYSRKINRLGFINCQMKANCNWLDKVNSKGKVPKNTPFNIEFINGNIQSPYATTK